jgi:hypothetical protein
MSDGVSITSYSRMMCGCMNKRRILISRLTVNKTTFPKHTLLLHVIQPHNHTSLVTETASKIPLTGGMSKILHEYDNCKNNSWFSRLCIKQCQWKQNEVQITICHTLSKVIDDSINAICINRKTLTESTFTQARTLNQTNAGPENEPETDEISIVENVNSGPSKL